MIRVLMVCTGNICRSPTAEGVLHHMVEARGLSDQIEVDSAGMIAYHVGESPDSRSSRTAQANGIDIRGQRARKLGPSDFTEFDYLLAMDSTHLRDMKAVAPEHAQDKIRMFLSFLNEPNNLEVPDPYYGGASGFENVFNLIQRGSEAFLAYLEAEGKI